MYLLLGSHDTKRLATVLEGDLQKVKMAFLYQFAFPGAPAIYYGDEVGLTGGKDPDCRRAFPWQEEKWDADLRDFVKELIDIRKRTPVLRRGTYQTLHADDQRGIFAFGRKLGEVGFLGVLNASSSRTHMQIRVDDLGWSEGRIVRDLLSGEEYDVAGDKINLNLPLWSGRWIF